MIFCTSDSRATYISVVVVGCFYLFTAWCLSTSVGSANVAAVAAADPGHFVLVNRPATYERIGASRVDEDVAPVQSTEVALERA